MTDFDVCIIGSGAGGGPVAWSLAQAGRAVVVLEKGPWLREADFPKDEITVVRREAFVPARCDEPQVVELSDGAGGFDAWPTPETGWQFANGSLVGGATNLMSGFFHRMKPIDFRLRSEFGPVEGADVVDWPLDLEALEPWYDRVERVVGVSGRVVAHPFADRRSSPDFPLPPLAEHPIAGWIDEVGAARGLHPFPIPRAVLSVPRPGRGVCTYTGFCGGYGCASGAKGSARAAFLEPAVATGRCEVRARAQVTRLESDTRGRVTHAVYRDAAGAERRVSARHFVVACQPIETARLLLRSVGPAHPAGLANRSGRVGQHLLFSTPAFAWGALRLDQLPPGRREALMDRQPFVHRALQDWYVIDDPVLGRRKGGTIDFLLQHANPIRRAQGAMYQEGRVAWGEGLRERVRDRFRGQRQLELEVFADWMPTPDSRVSLDPEVHDRHGERVARVRIGKHPHNLAAATYLAERGAEVLRALGCADVRLRHSGLPATNLVAGGCRFGRDPAQSVLDADCRAHTAENLYVTDGSFMPTGGSVPYTFTVYANALRVADRIAAA